jgi:hypothetical protein
LRLFVSFVDLNKRNFSCISDERDFPMAPVISEDFSTTDGGWNVNADARNFSHVPLSGAGGGYVAADDGVTGDLWYFTGGPEFTGNLSAYAGGTLSYTIRQAGTVGDLDDVDVIITGAARSIGFDFPADQIPGADFTDYTIELKSGQGWFDLTTQAALTDAEILAVLEDVQSLQIQGEYRTGSDAAQLDAVTLTSAGGGGLPASAPLPYRDGFAGGDDGWRITADGQNAVWQPTGGKTNGYLQASDRPSGDVWYFKTPEAFAGDYAGFAGGTLNYSLFQTSLSSQFDSDEDVRLIAASGQILAVDLPGDSQPGLDWTDYTIAFTEAGGWYDTVTDQVVTDAEIAAVLADLSSIEIRGEYRTGSDTAGLDDFALLGQGQVIEDFSNPGTAGDDMFAGTDGDDTFAGRAGADTFTPGGGNDTVDGGADTDTVIVSGDRDDYTVQITPDGVIVTDRTTGRDGSDTLIDVERIDFAGDNPAPNTLDLTVFADFATLQVDDFETFVEMYIAYFNRAPDALGLYFWGTVLAKGDLTLEQIADDFFTQPETQAAYPDLSDNRAFAEQVYQNVLGRDFDQAGLDFWVGVLDSGSVTKSQFILDLLGGVDAAPEPGSPADFIAQKAADAAYLEAKTDLGVYFSVQLGMSDVNDASATLALFDGSAASVTTARAAMDADYAEALDPASGDFLMQLVGVFDDAGVM